MDGGKGTAGKQWKRTEFIAVLKWGGGGVGVCVYIMLSGTTELARDYCAGQKKHSYSSQC